MATITASPQAADSAPVEPESQDLLGLLREIAARPDGKLRLGLAAACLVLHLALFWTSLAWFAFAWMNNENYSHGFLVPFISLYFAQHATRKGPIPWKDGTALGLAMIGVAVIVRWATVLIPVGIARDLAFLVGLGGVLSLLAGRAALWRYSFALGFLAFMIPIPDALYKSLASPLQLGVSRVATEALNLLGIPVLCEGNMMTLPGGVRMFVAEACSGMRQLTGFLALATAVAWLTPRPFWARAILVLSSIPIAMMANLVRVVVTGEIMFHLGSRYASGSFHTLEGLVMMGLGLLMLSVEIWFINQLIAPEVAPNPAPPRREEMPPRALPRTEGAAL